MAKKRSKYVAKIRASKKPAPVSDPKSEKLKELAAKEESFPETETPLAEAVKSEEQTKAVSTKKAAPKKSVQRTKKKFNIAKKFREIISELKKVDWPPFKSTPQRNGVLQSTSTVLVMVLIFVIVVVAFDSGLLQVLSLLTRASK